MRVMVSCILYQLATDDRRLEKRIYASQHEYLWIMATGCLSLFISAQHVYSTYMGTSKLAKDTVNSREHLLGNGSHTISPDCAMIPR